MTFEELASNSAMLIVAGSETTATLLSAATYYLGTHPKILAKLTDEVQKAFTSEEEIDMLSVQNLPYLLAVLDEASRIYPPVPGASPRKIGEGGDTILGEFFPEGVSACRSVSLILGADGCLHRHRSTSGSGPSITILPILRDRTSSSPSGGQVMRGSPTTRGKLCSLFPSALVTALARSEMHTPL